MLSGQNKVTGKQENPYMQVGLKRHKMPYMLYSNLLRECTWRYMPVETKFIKHFVSYFGSKSEISERSDMNIIERLFRVVKLA